SPPVRPTSRDRPDTRASPLPPRMEPSAVSSRAFVLKRARSVLSMSPVDRIPKIALFTRILPSSCGRARCQLPFYVKPVEITHGIGFHFFSENVGDLAPCQRHRRAALHREEETSLQACRALVRRILEP